MIEREDYASKVKELVDAMRAHGEKDFASLQMAVEDIRKYFNNNVMHFYDTSIYDEDYLIRNQKEDNAVQTINQLCEKYKVAPIFLHGYDVVDFAVDIYANDKQKEVFHDFTDIIDVCEMAYRPEPDYNIYKEAWAKNREQPTLDKLLNDDEELQMSFSEKIAELSVDFTFHPEIEDAERDRLQNDLCTIPTYFNAVLHTQGDSSSEMLRESAKNMIEAVNDVNKICKRYRKEKMFDTTHAEVFKEQCLDFYKEFFANSIQKEAFKTYDDVYAIAASVSYKSLNDICEDAMMRQMNKEASLDDVLNGFRNDAQNEMQQDNKNQNRNYQTVGNNDAR